MIARPTLTSAAATIITKNTKTCALVAIEYPKALVPARCIFENATNSKLTELSINSIHIKTMIELRRVSAPMTPIKNKANDKNKYHLISITTILHINLILHHLKQALLKKYLLSFLLQSD